MKKVIALLGSKRKVNTYKLLMQISNILAQEDVELEIIELYHYDLKDCIGCDCCVLKGKCVLHDDVDGLMDRISKADGVILASPVYLQNVSGKLKTFVDRTCHWYHRPVLTGKPVLCVASTKGSGLKATLAYMTNVSTQWGAIAAGTVGRQIFNIDKDIKVKELSKFIQLLNYPQNYSPTLNQLIGFEVQKALAKYLNGLDTKYWEEMNWMDKPYYYKCRVNIIKSTISRTIGSIIQKNMKKAMVVRI